MPSIEQPNTGAATGLDKTSFKPVEYFDDSVKRGYDWRNSQSKNEAVADAKQQALHRLMQPKVAAGSDSFSTVRTTFSSAGSMSLEPDQLKNFNFESISPQMKAVQENAKVMQGIQHLESVLGPVAPEKIGQVLKLINTAPPAMGPEEAWKWAEANLAPDELKLLELTMGKHGSDKFSFFDATTKLNALISGPPELVKEIKNEYNQLAKMMTKGDQLWDTDMISTMLSSIQQKMQDNRLKFDQENIKISQVEKERLSTKVINDLKEAIEKTDKAKKASGISKIFGYIGIAVMVAVTAIALISGVGAPAAILMITALFLTIVMTIDQETGGHVMKKITQGIQDAFGVDEETANWIAMGVIMAIMLALSFGGGAAGASAAGASKFAAMASKAGLIIGGGTAVAEGSAKAASAGYSYQASMLQAESKENKAKMLRIQQLIDEATESLQQALEDIQAGHARIAAIISNNDDTKKQLGRNLR